MMDILTNIKLIAKPKGISISKIERDLNFGTNSMYNWNRTNPSVDKVQAVANYLNVSLDEIVTGQPKFSTMVSDIFTQELIKEISGLDDIHKARISAYTQAQVEDQNRFNQPDTLAAHQADSNHHIDAKEAKKIANTLDDIIDKYEDKKK
ncbi:helix-turn-helix domain-containing protein [Levilactobacillus tujiorum]|uniref:helix-turn-helix domain-containing protein n=1 Tax=Levilactobacillus tujiorum TaxID=2912243 RepID=UPI001456C3E1|nr:helix-turn-helix transcriptional regulator [Levilactobacillus tujiorum]